MAVTRINNNQISDAVTGNTIVGINANTKVQPYSITSNLLANNFTYGSDFTIDGNLSVTGTTTAVDTTYTNIQDPLIVLADGQTSGTPAVDIGFIGLRGNQSNIAFAWNEANAEFATAFTTSGMGDDTTLAISSYADFKSKNVFTVTDVSAGGNVVGGNVLATTDVSAGGNVVGGNVLATTDVSAGGNVNGNNINSTNNVSAGGNITGASLLTNGAPGNISGTGWIIGGNITATGNIGAGSYLFGDGYYISNINAGNVNSTKIFNGGSYANIAATNGNLEIAIGSGSDVVATFYDQGVNFNIDVSVGGNVYTGAGISTVGDVTAGGNVIGGNVLATTDVSAGGNVTGGNLITSGSGGNIVGSGWVLAGYVSATSDVIAGANVLGNYVNATNDVSANGNVIGGNIFTNGDVTAGGNVYTDFAVRGGTLSSFGNTNVGGNLFVTGVASVNGRLLGNSISISGNIRVENNINANGNASISGNITAGNLLAYGASLQGNVFGYNISAYSNVYGSYAYITNDASAGGNVIGGNVVTNFLNSNGSDLQISASGTNAGISLFTNGGNIGAGNNWINNVVDPVQPQDAATKHYVDAVAQGLSVKNSVETSEDTYLANVAGVTNVVYNQPNGAGNGIGATLTITSTSAVLLDGVDLSTLQANARVLIDKETGSGANDTDAAWNGIYTVTSANTTNTVLTRSTDNDTASLMYGAFTFVAGGTIWKDTGWVCTNTAEFTPITMGLSAITWTQFTGAAQYTGGNGIQITGTVISTRVNTGNLEYDGSGNLQVSSSAQFTTPNIGSATGVQISVTGDVNSNNVGTTNDVSAGGNITGGNITGGNLYATTNVTAGGNITGGNLFTTGSGGNISGSGWVLSGYVSATSDVLAGTNVSAGGNVIGGNVVATTNVTAGGNVNGNNINSTNDLSAGGNIYATTNISAGGNVLVNINISAGGNVIGNVGSFANVTATGNIGAGSYLFGDGYFISNINGANVSTTKIANGTSNVNIPTASGNVLVTVDGNLVATFYDTGLNLQGNISTTSNVLVGTHAQIFGSSDGPNVYFSTNIVDTGTGILIDAGSANGVVISNDDENRLRVSSTFVGLETNSSPSGVASYTLQLDQAGNLTLGGSIGGGTFIAPVVTATGNVSGGNVNATTDISAGGNVFATTNISAGGNVNGNNVNATNTVSAGGNVNGNNINATNLVSATGNIQGAGTFLVDTTDNTVLMGNVTNLVQDSVLTLNATNSFVVPVGTTGQRPVTPYTGMMRFNTSTNQMEVYNNSEWTSVGGTSYTVITDEQFNGDGSTVTFTLSSSQTTSSCIVSINGVVQIPTLAYAVSGTTLTFTEAPAVGDVIDVRQLTTTTTVTYISNQSGNATVTANYAAAEVDVVGNLVASLSSSAPSLTANSKLSFQLVNNTTLAFVVRGTDGVTRTATVTLS